MLSPNWRRYLRTRRRLAQRYLAGSGLEIGALHMPLPLPAGAEVRYVDRMDLDQLRAEYPELEDSSLVSPDIVDDGERLSTIADDSADFIVANHFLEHCEDPIGTLHSHARVLRDRGVLYLALPQRGHGIDRLREPASTDHLLRDHREGPAWSRHAHYQEWVAALDVPSGRVDPHDVAAEAAALDRRRLNIHFHVWTAPEFSALIDACRAEGLPLGVECIKPNFHEFIAVLRKRAAPPAPRQPQRVARVLLRQPS